MLKKCSTCGEEKDIHLFCKSKDTISGYRSPCLECKKAMSEKWRQENPEKAQLASESWVLRNFERRKEWERNRYIQQKDRLKLLAKQWRSENLDKLRAKEARRRSKKTSAGGSFVPVQIEELMIKQKCKCPICGIGIKTNYHIDHVYPIALGGSSDIDNIQLLCPTCNYRKGASDPLEFLQSCGFLI